MSLDIESKLVANCRRVNELPQTMLVLPIDLVRAIIADLLAEREAEAKQSRLEPVASLPDNMYGFAMRVIGKVHAVDFQLSKAQTRGVEKLDYSKVGKFHQLMDMLASGPLYTAAPQKDGIPSLSPELMASLHRFNETVEDDHSYDIQKDHLHSLIEFGAIQRKSHSWCAITTFGQWLLRQAAHGIGAAGGD